MNRVVHAHLPDIMPPDPRPDAPVFLGGGARPNARFQSLCRLAAIKPRLDVESGRDAGDQTDAGCRTPKVSR
jgi:hypothetical protein